MYDLEPKAKPKVGCLGRIIRIVGVIAIIVVGLVIVIAMFGGSATEPLPPATVNVALLQPQAQAVSFEELARNTERYTGKLIYATGEVIQVMEERGNYTMRISITKNNFGWSDPILVLCNCATRPLEQDVVELVGEVAGRQTYKTVLGATVTLPMVTAKAFKVK